MCESTALILAKLVLRTAGRRERSWNPDTKGYAKGISQCAEEICIDSPELTTPVAVLLIGSWNDALDWARAIWYTGE